MTNRIRFLFIVLLTFLTLQVFAQSKELGIDFGFWRSKTANSSNFHNLSRIGASYYHTPKDAKTTLKTGLFYDSKFNSESQANFLRAPLHVDFKIGDKFQFLFGTGIYGSFLFKEQNFLPENENLLLKRLQFGALADLGFSYQLNSKLDINQINQINQDLTPLYKQTLYSSGSSKYTTSKKYKDMFVKVRWNIKLKNE